MTYDEIGYYERELSVLSTRGRELLDQGNAEAAKAVIDEAKELRRRIDLVRDDHEVRESMRNIPSPPGLVGSTGWAEVRKAMIEKRAITAGGAGQNTVPGIVRALVDGDKLAGKCSTFYGPNSTANVPVFAPHLAIPVGSAPGATGTASDTTAVLAGQALALKPYYSTLPVGMDAILSTDIEAELPSIFAEAFGAAFDKQIVAGSGSGNDGLGVFIASASGVPTSSDIECAAAGAPKWVDYQKLALNLNALSGGDRSSLAIIVHPNILAVALADSTAGSDPYKNEYLQKGTILGIPVVLSGHALTTLTAGSYVAVGGYFKHYAIAVANQLTIDPIKTVGSDNITFQAFMYLQFKPMLGGSFRRLKTV